MAELSTSPWAGTPTCSSAPSICSIGRYELLVTKRTRWPAARSRAMASAEPGMARWASQITPSRSQMTVGASGAGRLTGLDAAMPAWHPGLRAPLRALRRSPLRHDQGPPGEGRGPSLRRDERGGAPALRRPQRPQHRARRRAPRVRRSGPLPGGGRQPRPLAGGGHHRRRPATVLHAVPHGLHRRGRPATGDRRGHRRAGGRGRGRRRRAAASCPTSARRRRPPPTASTSPGPPKPTSPPSGGCPSPPG